MSLPAVCCACGAPLTIENLGALVPDVEEKEKGYCEKCKLEAVDDYADWWKQIEALR